MTSRTLATLFLSALTPAMLFAESKEQPEVETIDFKPKRSARDLAGRPAPLALTSAEDAGKQFKGDELKTLNKLVNWQTQKVVFFAWAGSGGDRLTAQIKQEAGRQSIVQFRHKPGRTRDLRPHVYTFAVRKDVKWELVK